MFGYFPKVGIFIQGCWIGLIISLTLNNVAFYHIKSNPANLTLWIVMPILCVLFGVLSLFIKKTFIIFATCILFIKFSLNRSIYVLKSPQLVSRSISQLILACQKISFRISWASHLEILSICNFFSHFNRFSIRVTILAIHKEIRNNKMPRHRRIVRKHGSRNKLKKAKHDKHRT